MGHQNTSDLIEAYLKKILDCGYIRIEKVKIADKHRFLEQVDGLFDQSLTEKEALAIVQKLYEEDILTKSEGNLLLATMAKSVLGSISEENKIRASIMHAVLVRLSYEDKKR